MSSNQRICRQLGGTTGGGFPIAGVPGVDGCLRVAVVEGGG
jgi:hypothetical protein